jgi:predicted HicB family RNase H-like nuclease
MVIDNKELIEKCDRLANEVKRAASQLKKIRAVTKYSEEVSLEEKKEPGNGEATNKHEKKKLSLRISKPLWVRLKLKTIDEEDSMHSIVCRAIENYLSK